MSQGKSVRRNIRNNRYYYVAEAAAIAEGLGEYERAGKLWLKAAKLSGKQINAEWSEHRSQFCQSVLRNGWS